MSGTGRIQQESRQLRLLRLRLLQLQDTCDAIGTQLQVLATARAMVPNDDGTLLRGAARVTDLSPDQARQHREKVMSVLSGRRILVADDSEVNRHLATHLLTDVGCNVETVENGREAVVAITRSRYDVVLMDCGMPIMDGFAATTAIRAWESGRYGKQPRLPIIALTADSTDDQRKRCAEVGMDDFLTKPYRPRRLLSLLMHWVGEASSADA